MTFPGKRAACVLAALAAMAATATAGHAGTYNLTVDPVKIDSGDFVKDGIGYNGASPGPVLRFREGEEVTINVTNNLNEPTSIHWHGLIVPFEQDGVPTISFDGSRPLRFRVSRSDSNVQYGKGAASLNCPELSFRPTKRNVPASECRTHRSRNRCS